MEKKVEKKERKRPVLIGTIILVVFIAAGLGFGVYWLVDSIRYVATDDAAVDGDHVNLSSKMLGRISSIPVSEGDRVEKGQLLIQLDDADLHAQEVQALASLNYARQNLILAKVNQDKTKDDLVRTKSLFDSGVSTKEQYIHASKALDTANAQYAIAGAQVETAEAQLKVIETQLENTRITAPISGYIAKQVLMQGDVAAAGQTIISINDLKNVWIVANFEETKIRHISPGAPVEITVDAYPNYRFKGHVEMIGYGIVAPPFSIGEFTKTTQRVPVRIAFDNIPEKMRILPGMSVEVKVRSK